MAGVNGAINADKAGQDRTTPRTGSTNLGQYTAKKGIDLLFKMAETSLNGPPKATSSTIANTGVGGSLQILKAGESLAESKKLRVDKVALSQKYADFLVELAYPFKILIWGLPGSGKSTFSMALANEISNNCQLAYISGEEALNSPTLLDKQRRTLTGQNTNRCLFLNRLPNSETEWKQVLVNNNVFQIAPFKAVFYDSVTKLGITPFYVSAAANDYHIPEFEKSISHVFITHAHKDGQQYRGDGSWGHEVDVIIRVEKGIATTEKNRFGAVGKSLKVF
ncbi:hypothetical protein CWM47_33530 [Spirosoma pollinicola]|uniref:AAA+ ATPase domain-containing protein n=2 Tax=Spirosoma pollinicola TaxID=2057025 RepID=A0A2K8Z8Z0_9BACT|nr:hypothetical protein CWM47_33530 [Spirosoma pollinicola]